MLNHEITNQKTKLEALEKRVSEQRAKRAENPGEAYKPLDANIAATEREIAEGQRKLARLLKQAKRVE